MLLVSRCLLCEWPGPSVCAGCLAALAPAPGLAPVRALTRYEGTEQRLLTALKFRGRRALAGPIGSAMAALVTDPVDVVSWAPTTAARRRQRGYDQARLLAQSVARTLGRPCRSYLRHLPGGAQTGRSRDDRLTGPVFVAWRLPPARVLVVDDIVTTGATLFAARRALLDAGARDVQLLAAAATP